MSRERPTDTRAFGYGINAAGEETYNGASVVGNRRRSFRHMAWLHLEGPASRARCILQSCRDDAARGVTLCDLDKLRCLEAQREAGARAGEEALVVTTTGRAWRP